MTVAETANATSPVAAKLRCANRRRSTMGAVARNSQPMKPASAAAATANKMMIWVLAQPTALPRMSANIRAVRATVIAAVPGQSARPPPRPRIPPRRRAG